MGRRIIYYYAVVSGFAYLGEPELKRIAEAAGAEIDYRPVDIQKVFAASGTTPPPRQSDARRAYRDIELARWAKRRGLPLNVKPRFWPVDTEPASRAVLAAQDVGADPGPLSFAFLRAVWAEDQNIADADTVAAIVSEAATASQADEILARAASPDIGAQFTRIER